MIDAFVVNRAVQARTGDDLAKLLWQLLASDVAVWTNEDGTECFYNTRALVEKIHGVRIEIRPRDHAPPHFHVQYGRMSAAFLIENGELLEGRLGKREQRIVRHYLYLAKPKLIEVWNSTRASDSPVGEYRPTEKDAVSRSFLSQM